MDGPRSGSPIWPPSSPRPAEARPGDLAANVTLFGRRLRGRGLLVGPEEISLALCALAETDVTDREGVRLALRSVFCSRVDDLRIFDEEFARFWLAPETALAAPRQEEGGPQDARAPGDGQGAVSLREWSGGEAGEEGEQSVPAYSPAELRARKDFSSFSADDLQALSELIVHLARRIATCLSRRLRAARRGHLVDFRRTIRRSLQFGGTALALAWQRRKIRKAKLVLLCDVSGSMDIYSRFLVQFIYALQEALGRVESFLFSTSLTRVTEALDRRDIREALEEAARLVPDWSGGTKIGACLREFNEQYAARCVDGRTIVVICSDGWDTGDLDVLVSAMRTLRARAGKLIWLNPLLGSPGYEPATLGMSAALPFVDVFASAHNLRSLQELERHLREPRRRAVRPTRRAAGRG